MSKKKIRAFTELRCAVQRSKCKRRRQKKREKRAKKKKNSPRKNGLFCIFFFLLSINPCKRVKSLDPYILYSFLALSPQFTHCSNSGAWLLYLWCWCLQSRVTARFLDDMSSGRVSYNLLLLLFRKVESGVWRYVLYWSILNSVNCQVY